MTLRTTPVRCAWAETHPLLRLDAPAPGAAHLFALPMQGQVYLPVRFYLYGDQARAAVERAEPSWQRWMSEHVAPAAVQRGVA